MENEEKKCSNIKHSQIAAISYCPECDLYLCNKCINTHSEFFINHEIHNVNNKNSNEIISDRCNELNHKLNLQYFCKSHNKLCCAACLSKIKEKGNGQHFDCEVCLIEDIKEEKKNKLEENLKYLEDFSKTIDDSLNKLKELIKNIDENKDELKKKISEVFTKIRSALNEREDELFLKVDNLLENNFIKEYQIKKLEKEPNRIKLYLEKGKIINEDWNDNNKLIGNIYNCVNIENDIKNIMEIKESIKKYNTEEMIIKFNIDENDLNKFLESIKSFGTIGNEEKIFKFKFNTRTNYTITNNGLNLTKTKSGWEALIKGDIAIPKNKISKWKLKINTNINQSFDDVYIGVGKMNSKGINECWSIYSHTSEIQINLEGNCSSYNDHKEILKKGDIIEVITNRISNQLSFSVNGVNFGIACQNLPKDEELFPTVLLYEKNLNIEIV